MGRKRQTVTETRCTAAQKKKKSEYKWGGKEEPFLRSHFGGEAGEKEKKNSRTLHQPSDPAETEKKKKTNGNGRAVHHC